MSHKSIKSKITFSSLPIKHFTIRIIINLKGICTIWSLSRVNLQKKRIFLVFNLANSLDQRKGNQEVLEFQGNLLIKSGHKFKSNFC